MFAESPSKASQASKAAQAAEVTAAAARKAGANIFDALQRAENAAGTGKQAQKAGLAGLSKGFEDANTTIYTSPNNAGLLDKVLGGKLALASLRVELLEEVRQAIWSVAYTYRLELTVVLQGKARSFQS